MRGASHNPVTPLAARRLWDTGCGSAGGVAGGLASAAEATVSSTAHYVCSDVTTKTAEMTSSVSANGREPLCGLVVSQVAQNRRCQSYRFIWCAVMRSPNCAMNPRDPLCASLRLCSASGPQPAYLPATIPSRRPRLQYSPRDPSCRSHSLRAMPSKWRGIGHEQGDEARPGAGVPPMSRYELPSAAGAPSPQERRLGIPRVAGFVVAGRECPDIRHAVCCPACVPPSASAVGVSRPHPPVRTRSGS
jgi:hypothetical protein